MANESQSLDILIRFISQQYGVKPEEVLKQVQDATKKTADENERYQQTLEKMRVAQVMESQEKQKAVKWTQSHQEGTADLSKTLEGLRANVAKGTKETEENTDATDKTFASKKQLKDMVKQLGHEFPLLGMAGRLAMNPIVAATTAVTLAIINLSQKTREATKDLGGIEMPDFTEDAVARYERIASASEKIKNNVSAIADVFTEFEKNQKIIDAFVSGFGNPPDRTNMMAAAAREAGDRETAESIRLRAISGNFNPENSAAAEKAAKEQIVALLAEKARLDARIKIAQDASQKDADWSWGGIPAGFKYLWTFGVSDPDRKAAQLEDRRGEINLKLSRLQGSGRRRGERAGAFANAEEADTRAAGFYEQAASYGAAGASTQGANLKAAQEALAKGDFTSLSRNLVALADAIKEGNQTTVQALADQAKANQDLKRVVNSNNQR